MFWIMSFIALTDEMRYAVLLLIGMALDNLYHWIYLQICQIRASLTLKCSYLDVHIFSISLDSYLLRDATVYFLRHNKAPFLALVTTRHPKRVVLMLVLF